MLPPYITQLEELIKTSDQEIKKAEEAFEKTVADARKRKTMAQEMIKLYHKYYGEEKS